MSDAADVAARDGTVAVLESEKGGEIASAGNPDAKREAGDIIAAELEVQR